MVYVDDPGIVRGQTSPIVTVVVAPGRTDLPKAPTSASITRSRSTLKASWHIVPHEGGSEIYDYRLRYRRVGESNWKYVLLHAPYDIPCHWDTTSLAGRQEAGKSAACSRARARGSWLSSPATRTARARGCACPTCRARAFCVTGVGAPRSTAPPLRRALRARALSQSPPEGERLKVVSPRGREA